MLNPFVLWGQKADSISLKVDLRDVTVNSVNFTEDKLEVCVEGVGAQGRNKYGFEIEFHSLVDLKSSKYKTTDNAIEFSIKKKVNEVWPRLTKSKVKLPWLKIDFDKFADGDDEDDEDEKKLADKQAADELVRQIEKDLKEDTVNSSSVKSTYLVTYNFLQFVGYLYIVFSLAYNYLKYGEVVKQRAFDLVGYQIMVCQAAAFLEILHPLLGLVNTGLLAPILQVSGRAFILFGLIQQDVRLQDAPVVWYLLLTWSSVELIRYPFYMFSSLGMDITVVTWLRYSAWIILYPVGILCEGTVVIMSIPLFKESGVFSVQLPNSSNFAFYFPWFLYFYLFLLAAGGIQVIKHMYSLRKKKFGATPVKKRK